MIDFAWIYIESPSYFRKTGIFNELDYSIRSVRKNFKGVGDCYVVGDNPHLDVKHIEVQRIETSKWGYFRHFDQIKKLKAILDSDISDDFVLMYDDIYLINKVKRSDLAKFIIIKIIYIYRKIGFQYSIFISFNKFNSSDLFRIYK